MEVGERVRARREQLGLTQAELAAELGVTHQHVSAIEGGTSAPSLDLLVRLGRTLGVSIDELLTGADRLVPDTEGAIRAEALLSREAKRQLVGLLRLLRSSSR